MRIFFLKKNTIIFVLIFIVALLFRLPYLDDRPMHGDEAVNAVKFSELLELGKFEYDPKEYHGPTLYYFTLPAAWISGSSSLNELNENILRILPVIFGIGLLFLLLIIKPLMGWKIPLTAGFFVSISPAFVFYSRYYIHEIMFVFFCYLFLFSAFRCVHDKSLKWIVLIGLSLGLLISTKETWMILIISMLLSVLILFLMSAKNKKFIITYIKSISLKDFIVSSSLFLVTVLFLYSSFFTYPEGLTKGVSALSSYFHRIADHEIHIYPWYMYFYWLVGFKGIDGSYWGEWIIAAFAIPGIISVIFGKHNLQHNKFYLHFLLLFVLISTFMFSVIPYKTPWNFLSFWFGIIILAALGVNYLFDQVSQRYLRLVLSIFGICAVLHLGWQSYHLNFELSSDVNNPYVYAHPGKDVFKIRNKLEKLASMHIDGYDIYIQVIAESSDYWPLPWYLRKFNKIGWWNNIDMKTPPAPVIIAQPEFEDKLLYMLYEIPPPGQRHLYLPLFNEITELRPGKEIRGYIRKDYWDLLNHLNMGIEISNEDK